MPQIAQQDHLYVDVESLEEMDLTDEQKAKLVECYKAGTILDVVLVDRYKAMAKILAIEVAETDLNISYIYENVTLMLTLDMS